MLADVFDAHCHLDDEAFDHDRTAVWERACAAGVRGLVVPGVAPERWSRTLACCERPHRFAALGVHPHALPAMTDAEVRAGLDEIPSLVRRSTGLVVAIGEVGFDRTIDLERASEQRQATIVRWHAELAKSLGLPLVLHVLRAHDLALATLERLALPSPAGVVHSYSGPAELVHRYEQLGFFVSFSGSITRPRARRPLEALRRVSPDRLLLETDAPDQCPTGVDEHVRRNEPAHLALVLRAAARALAQREESLRERTEGNARALFGV
jgi:TatD DNase family protein